MANSGKIQKPFLKWVGGKTQIIEQVLQKVPKTISNYHEIFLGGGSVLLAILSLQKEGKITIKNKVYAYDLNDKLIDLYKHIQCNKELLYEFITEYSREYASCEGNEINRKPKTIEEAKTSKESYYYWMRNLYNTRSEGTIEQAALFLVLNKTCFRGMYREGPNGYNVPYGHYKTTPTIITASELNNISDLIKDVTFTCSDFSNSMKSRNIKKGDFLYLDPPYAPETATSFVGYTKDGFGTENHQTLFELTDELNKRGIKLMMSNANVKLVSDFFKNYNLEQISCRRAINSKNPASIVTELIITN